MTTLKEFAIKIGDKYGVRATTENLTGSEGTMFEFAKAILPKEALVQWLKDSNEEIKKLRQELNIEPYDKFDEEILAEITKLS